MNLLALKMLTGDRAKYLGIISGLTFAALLIVQQAGIFCGFLAMTYTSVSRIPEAQLWIADPDVRFIDDGRPMSDSALLRVRSIPGVAWAVPYYKGILHVRLPDGRGQTCTLTGVDDNSFIGGPRQSELLAGNIADLKQADAVIIDSRTATTLFAVRTGPGASDKRPIRLGETIELNDQRATVVGICRTLLQLQGEATVFTTFTRALKFAPTERRMLSFVLAAPLPGQDINVVADRIRTATHLAAFTPAQFKDKTYAFFVFEGGFGVFFGITVLFGVIIGVGIAGQMFYNFVNDNLRYFAVLKAMGTDNFRLIRLVILQATIAGLLGWGLGIGLAGAFGLVVRNSDKIVFKIPLELFMGSAGVMLLIAWTSALLSIRTVIRLDAATVFK